MQFLGGSPPLTREPQIFPIQIIDQVGITPAYAGTTFRKVAHKDPEEDHPRLRGNHPLAVS